MPSSPRAKQALQHASARLIPALQEQGRTLGDAVFIRIFKEEAELEVWLADETRFHLFRRYPICTFSGSLGPKLKEGDGQSPEGFYAVSPRLMNPQSQFHLSFNLGFPNAYDRAHKRTGSYLMVHGDCVSIGCYAMATSRFPFAENRNAPIEDIWTLIAKAFEGGQAFIRVHAFPFRMTDENMARHSASPWAPFWQNLKEGYDHFEATNRPPNTEVEKGRYVFEEAGVRR